MRSRPCWRSRGAGAGRRAAQTKTGTTFGAVPADRAERARRRAWATPASALPTGSRRSTTTRRAIGRDRAARGAVLARRLARRTSTTTTSRRRSRWASWGTLFASVTVAQLGRHRRAHRRASRSAPASASRSPTSRSGSGYGAPDHRPLLGRRAGHATCRRRSGTPRPSAVTFDIGTLYRVADNGLRIGASLSNFGTQARVTTGRDLRDHLRQDPTATATTARCPASGSPDEFPVPVLFRVGRRRCRVRLEPGARPAVALDALHPSDNTESMSLGAECDVPRRARAARRLAEPVPRRTRRSG